MDDQALETWMDATAGILEIEIPELCRAGVLENLKRNFAVAEMFRAFNLPAETELAPIFIA